jgi:short-subunit dehydrogenase
MKRNSLVFQMLTGIAGAVAAYTLDSFKGGKTEGSGSRRERRVVLITGGSRGLGLAMAERFAREGNRLVLAARDMEELTAARSQLLKNRAILATEDVLLIPADLTDQVQAANLVEHAIEHFGRIDVLINNAGIIEVGPVEEQPVEAYRRAMATNFFAALYTTQAVLPYMLYRDRRNPASIVNICSIGGKVAVPHMLPYTASKFALVGFSEGLHAELRHKGVRVTTVCPWLMRTGGHHHASFTGNRKKEERLFSLAATLPLVSISAKRAANQIYHAVAQGRAEILIAPQAWLAARAAALAPETVQRLSSLANQFLLPGAQSREIGSAVARKAEDDAERVQAKATRAPWTSTASQTVM